jgi:hypothetical protein
MQARMFLTIMSVMSLLFSATALAHITESGGALPHIFTGEHLLVLAVVAVGIAGLSKLYRRFR